jgi:DNA polymerase-3 subunit epsilon
MLQWIGRLWPAPAHAAPRWVVVDVETSGLDAGADDLISIGAVAMRGDGRILPADSFEVVLRQERASTRDNILVHRVGVLAQARGVDRVPALEAFLDYVGVAPLVAWHAPFDRGFLARALRMYVNLPFSNRWLDLAQLAPALLPQVPAKGLDQWLAHFGIEVTARHSAAADAFATAQLCARLLPIARAQGARTFGALQRAARARRWLAA